MDSREGYNSYRGRGRDYDPNYDDGYHGGSGGGRGRGRGRGGFYNDGGWQNFQASPRRQYQNDFEHGGYQDSGRGRGRGRGQYQNWGRGNRGSYKWERNRPGDVQNREEERLAPDVAVLTELTGHTKKITALVYDPNSQQIYTGSADGTVKAWSTVTGQCTSSVEVGGEVDSILAGGGYLFVGYHKGTEGIIKVWNMASGATHLLTGHKGQVLALVIAATSLVSAGQDATIRVWAFNQQAQIFMSSAIITKEDGGHNSAVHTLCVQGGLMFSGDRTGNILVWDLATGKVAQRIASAHNDQPIMHLIPFESHLLSAGMDGLVRCWQILEAPQPGMLVNPAPEYVFNKDDPEGNSEQQQQQDRDRGYRRGRGIQPPGIVTMSGALDTAGAPVLMVAYNGESCVRLYQLPEFSSRGVLTPASDTRVLGSVGSTVLLTGDSNGIVRVFNWKTAAPTP